MKPELEKYIQNNLDELDLKKPDPEVLNRILQQMKPVEKTVHRGIVIPFRIIRLAAACTAAIVCGLIIWKFQKDTPPDTVKTVVNVPQPVAAQRKDSATHKGMDIADEDLAIRKAAVATAVGGIPEVVVDGVTGYLVPPRDPPALATRIVELLKNRSLRERMGHAALDRARECFTVAKMVDGTAAVYRSLATGTVSRAAAD